MFSIQTARTDRVTCAVVRAACGALVVALAGSLAACDSGGGQTWEAAPTPATSPSGKGSQVSAMPTGAKIMFLHHSTGGVIWDGGVPGWFDTYNAAHQTSYRITQQEFPKDEPYGWNNYPYDYWNIWINHAGPVPHKGEPTLEMMVPEYDVIVWKHCFPVSSVEPDTGTPKVTSSDKRLENYQLQYLALREKMRSFPTTRFVVWTSAALIQRETSQAEAERSRAFVDWVRTTWDERGDNIYVWDFWQLETEGRGYLVAGNAAESDSHPSAAFAKRVAPQFAQRVVDVIEGRGDL
ncbi:MAG: hypothetical protein JXA67_08075 [Micromonosporaceae bacterium]|nr:hypothetical protein [Micromonosporaceae bacterium]